MSFCVGERFIIQLYWFWVAMAAIKKATPLRKASYTWRATIIPVEPSTA